MLDRFAWLWFIWLVCGLTIEVYALATRVPGRTLSEVVWYITRNYPLLPLAFGLLLGHFFWQRVS